MVCETYFCGSYSMVLCIIIAWIFSSSEPFIRDKSRFAFSDSIVGWWWWLIMLSEFFCCCSCGFHCFLYWVVSGILAIISDVFFGIKQLSSPYSEKREFEKKSSLKFCNILNGRKGQKIDNWKAQYWIIENYVVSCNLTFFCLGICNLQIKIMRFAESLLMDDSFLQIQYRYVESVKAKNKKNQLISV